MCKKVIESEYMTSPEVIKQTCLSKDIPAALLAQQNPVSPHASEDGQECKTLVLCAPSANQSLPSPYTIEASNLHLEENVHDIQVATLTSNAQNVIGLKNEFSLALLLEMTCLSSLMQEDGTFVSRWNGQLILKWAEVGKVFISKSN
jgi:hypothetical protein